MIVVNIIGISILSIFLLFIFLKRKKITSDYLLILTTFVLGSSLFSEIWISQGLTLSNYIFYFFSNTIIFPCFLTYGMVLIDEEHKIKKEWWWIPSFAIVFIAYIFVDTLFLNDYDTQEKLKKLFESPPFVRQLFYKTHYIFIIVALVWFLKKIKSYVLKIKNHYSSIELLHLNWFRNFTYVYLTFSVFEITMFSIYDLRILTNVYEALAVSSFLRVISLFYLCYNGIRQYTIAEFNDGQVLDEFTMGHGKDTFESQSSSNDLKYRYSSLSEAEMDGIFGQIKELFETENIYLEPHLKIEELAKQLRVTPHNVSQTINLKAEKPFYDFVNEYRLNHFKKLLADAENRKFTILALGIESGFNSKATLNRVFKQNIGQSPREFQRSHFIK